MEIKSRKKMILIKTGTLGYADMVKNVKESITYPEILGVSIQTIVKSENDEMKIPTEKGKGSLLKSEILDKIKDTVVQVKEDKMTIKVLYIEEGYSKQDIIRDIKKNVDCPNIEESNVTSLIDTKKGYQIVILALDTKVALSVLKKGVLKIGWVGVHCDAKKNISTRRCMNCLKVGYRADQCKEGGKMSFAALGAQKLDIKLRTVKEPTSAWVVKKRVTLITSRAVLYLKNICERKRWIY